MHFIEVSTKRNYMQEIWRLEFFESVFVMKFIGN